ncbi:pyrophosphatase [Streptomyces sp. NPDC051554]|uniref:pyrophosphatase n=1 Tax=Streptomyces sp. NPDC051554 TaxID=3365656 RepID=UPI0037A6B4EF
MEFSTFQRETRGTSQLRTGGPQAALQPMLGLASETGSVLNAYKKYLREGISLETNKEFVSEELGDLLWYIAAVATALNLDLDAIAEANLQRTKDRYASRPFEDCLDDLPILDSEYPEVERFPRRLVIEFSQHRVDRGRMVGRMRLVEAIPNAFPDGRKVSRTGKPLGYSVRSVLGDELTDNTRQTDAYRFHDAIHLGFLAVLGWSPNMRSLLGIKRKSNPETDEVEDGARAIFAEEGLAAVLSRLAQRRMSFLEETNIDGEVIDVAKAAAATLEVEALPGWLWQRAICHGFRGMMKLAENGGGFLVADLDARSLTYEKVMAGE